MAIVLVVCGVFIMFGLWLLGKSLHALLWTLRARAWPTTEGELLTCYVDETPGRTPMWRVQARYGYLVAGESYESDQILFGYNASNLKSEHEKLHDKLSNAPRVTVHYQPEDPANAVLVAGANRHTTFSVAFTLVWIAMVTAIAILSQKVG